VIVVVAVGTSAGPVQIASGIRIALACRQMKYVETITAMNGFTVKVSARAVVTVKDVAIRPVVPVPTLRLLQMLSAIVQLLILLFLVHGVRAKRLVALVGEVGLKIMVIVP